MRKKIISLLLILIVILSGCGKSEKNTQNVKIYYIDSELLMLVGMPEKISSNNIQEAAEKVIRKLVGGQDFNRKIKRQIPNIKNGISVKVENKTANVNFSSEFVEAHSEGRIAERLTVYQIVNSLTSLDGIDSVTFTINGEKCKCFKGFIDMRQAFTHKELVL